jgi:hypothetical protein
MDARKLLFFSSFCRKPTHSVAFGCGPASKRDAVRRPSRPRRRRPRGLLRQHFAVHRRVAAAIPGGRCGTDDVVGDCEQPDKRVFRPWWSSSARRKCGGCWARRRRNSENLAACSTGWPSYSGRRRARSRRRERGPTRWRSGCAKSSRWIRSRVRRSRRCRRDWPGIRQRG